MDYSLLLGVHHDVPTLQTSENDQSAVLSPLKDNGLEVCNVLLLVEGFLLLCCDRRWKLSDLAWDHWFSSDLESKEEGMIVMMVFVLMCDMMCYVIVGAIV